MTITRFSIVDSLTLLFPTQTLNLLIAGDKHEKKRNILFIFHKFTKNYSKFLVRLTPASADAVRGADFAIAKFRDAYGSPLDAIVMCFVTINRTTFMQLLLIDFHKECVTPCVDVLSFLNSKGVYD